MMKPTLAGPQPGFFEGNEPIETSVRAFDEGYNEPKTESVDVIAYSLFMAVVVIAITLCCVFCREERDGTVRVEMFVSDRHTAICFIVFLIPFFI